MKYSKVFTLKTSPEWVNTLEEVAAHANRNRCQWLRDVANLMATRPALRNLINEEMEEADIDRSKRC